MVNLLVLGLMLVDSFLGALAALTIKKGSNKFSFFNLWKTWHLWLGLFLYGVSIIIYMVVLQLEELTVIYPLVAMGYIWTTILAVRYLGDKMNVWKYLGLFGIVLGVMFISLGS